MPKSCLNLKIWL